MPWIPSPPDLTPRAYHHISFAPSGLAVRDALATDSVRARSYVSYLSFVGLADYQASFVRVSAIPYVGRKKIAVTYRLIFARRCTRQRPRIAHWNTVDQLPPRLEDLSPTENARLAYCDVHRGRLGIATFRKSTLSKGRLT